MQTKGRKMKSFLIAMIALILVGCGSQSRLDISELDKCISKSTDVDSLVITISDKRLNSQATMLNWKEEETQYGARVYVKKGDQEVKAEKTIVELVEYRPTKQKSIFARKIGDMLAVEGVNETDHRGPLSDKVILEGILAPAVVEDEDSIVFAEGYELSKESSNTYEIQPSNEEGFKYMIQMDDEGRIEEITVSDLEEVVKTAKFAYSLSESEEKEKSQIKEILNLKNISGGSLIDDFQNV